MKKYFAIGIVSLLVMAGAVISASAAMKGDYVEVRSSDIYTGPCFANSEVNLEGKQAMMAWRVNQGSFDGVNLDGLSVMAVVLAHSTLGDEFHNPYPAKSVLIVDERANGSQRAALQAFARSMGGPLLAHVVRVDAAPIRLDMGEMHGSVTLTAGKLAHIKTRGICDADHLCGNESVYYPPLTKLAHSMPAFTLEEGFAGKGLGEVWTREDTRSAFVGTFSL
ncbi:MAG TPA: DUF1326 domain-containing protein [Terriglobia bacterium]|nr:DUF1326 domain-containing protein [Terriglobia bacterium]